MAQATQTYELIPVVARQLSDPLRAKYIASLRKKAGGDLVVAGNSWVCLQFLSFDTDCFGMNIGRVPFGQIQEADIEAILEAIKKCARDRGIRHLNLRFSSRYMALAQRFLASGWYLADLQATLETHFTTPYAEPKRELEVVSQVTDEEIELLAEGSRAAFDQSRFANDPHLSDEGTGEVYSRWARNDMRGRADTTFIVRLNGQAVGYNTNIISPAEPEFGIPAHADIDLVAVMPEARGKGVAAALVAEAVRHYSTLVEVLYVGTQGANIPAFRLYESAGFRLIGQDLTLHWFDGA